MERPFEERRKLGPFFQTGEEDPRNTYLIIHQVKTDEVLDGSDVQELERSIENDRDVNGGDLFAIVEDVSIDKSGLSSINAAGEERVLDIKTKITPDLQSLEDRFVLTKTMIDVIEQNIKDKFGSDSLTRPWSLDVVE